MTKKLKIRILQKVSDVSFGAGVEIVDAEDVVPFLEKSCTEVGA